MPLSNFVKGKRETRMLNGHEVVVIMPNKSISYEEGVKKLEELVDKIQNKKS